MFCDQRTERTRYRDFPGANNGLQIENNGVVTKIGAAVDAGLYPFFAAAEQGVDFLIVHHGLFWSPATAYTGSHYKRLKFAFDHNLAVYSSHLPLDGHPAIGNNALLADALGLEVDRFFLEYEGMPIALLAKCDCDISALCQQMHALFPTTFQKILFGSKKPGKVAILTGSGRSALPHLLANGTDTLVTGELRQEHFNFAQEHGLNLLLGGHYHTEVFGVRALAAEVASHFNLEHVFLPQPCPL
ncbi:MAG: Nif3-like dinuclear metal center hexameric protein [Verrucomicrobia bacterium]|nr:Nif3-like dinuclear metal center hexameric protein [Verrucomicrobiota bacterium]